MTDDARRADSTRRRMLAAADQVLAYGDAPMAPRAGRVPDQVPRIPRARLVNEDAAIGYAFPGVRAAHPDPGDEQSPRARGTDVTEDGDRDRTRCATCDQDLRVDTYVAERDQARAELTTIRRLVERHLTTHGRYADRRLRDWYEATATPRTRW